MALPSLPVLVDYLELLAAVKPEKLGPATVRWQARRVARNRPRTARRSMCQYRRVAGLRIVYADGAAEDLVPTGRRIERGDLVWTPRGDFEVAYVKNSFASEETIVYLTVLPVEAVKATKIFFNVSGGVFPLLLPEAAELADRLRRQGGGDVGVPATAVAVRIEQFLERAAGGSLRMNLTDGEMSALRWALEGWVTEVGATALSERVMDLRYGLHRGSSGPLLR